MVGRWTGVGVVGRQGCGGSKERSNRLGIRQIAAEPLGSLSVLPLQVLSTLESSQKIWAILLCQRRYPGTKTAEEQFSNGGSELIHSGAHPQIWRHWIRGNHHRTADFNRVEDLNTVLRAGVDNYLTRTYRGCDFFGNRGESLTLDVQDDDLQVGDVVEIGELNNLVTVGAQKLCEM